MPVSMWLLVVRPCLVVRRSDARCIRAYCGGSLWFFVWYYCTGSLAEQINNELKPVWSCMVIFDELNISSQFQSLYRESRKVLHA